MEKEIESLNKKITDQQISGVIYKLNFLEQLVEYFGGDGLLKKVHVEIERDYYRKLVSDYLKPFGNPSSDDSAN